MCFLIIRRMSNDVLKYVTDAIAEQIYEFLMRKLPEKLLEEIVVNVSFVDLERYTLEISIDVLSNPVLAGVERVVDEAVEYGFKIADCLMEKLKRGELDGLSDREIRRVAKECAKGLHSDSQERRS